jgi:hypothetical protein
MVSPASNTIMIVDLSVEPARQSQFDSFYHDFYIPEFLKAVPEIVTARRYAQTDTVGNFDPAKVRFLSIYELASDDSVNDIEAAIARSAHQEASAQFKVWKQNGLTHFERAFYREVKRHPHQQSESVDKSSNNRSLCAFTWSLKADVESSAASWYLDEYVKLLMSTEPSWLACRTYQRMNLAPPSFLTIFEAIDQPSLLQSMTTANEGLSEADQTRFTNWQHTLATHQTLSFEAIYFLSNEDARGLD